MTRIINSFNWTFLAFLLCGFGFSACIAGTNAGLDNCLDADGDGICDDEDLCQGDNSNGDEDGDGICDLGQTGDPLDSDGDGVPDSEDVCEGHDDNVDENANGTPDGCDVCADDDGDGVCNEDDLCEGHDDNEDIDNNDIPDACDQCVDMPDGTFDCKNACFDQGGDADGDTICDDDDKCLGDANPACCKTEDHCTSNQTCEYTDPGDPSGICTDVVDPVATPCTRHSECAGDEFCASLLERDQVTEDGEVNCYDIGSWDDPMPAGICKPLLSEAECATAVIDPGCTCDNEFVISTCMLQVEGARIRHDDLCGPVSCVSNADCPPQWECHGDMANTCVKISNP